MGAGLVFAWGRPSVCMGVGRPIVFGTVLLTFEDFSGTRYSVSKTVVSHLSLLKVQ